MPGRPRKTGYEKYRIQPNHQSTRELVHHLLVTELGAVLVPDSDKTVPQPWAAPRLTEQEMKDMGVFDSLAEEGIDLGEIELNPTFNYPDDVYIMAFAKGEFKPRKNKDWDDQIACTYLIVSLANEEETKYRGKKYTEWLSIPDAKKLRSDDKETRDKANGALNRTFQRLYQLGIKDPKSLELEELNWLAGQQYVIQLNTPKDNNDKGKQFILGRVKPLAEMGEGGNPFDEDDE